MALGKSLHLFKTYFPHLWKKHNTVPGGVLVRTKCLVHLLIPNTKIPNTGPVRSRDSVHSGDGLRAAALIALLS